MKIKRKKIRTGPRIDRKKNLKIKNKVYELERL